jgi:tRNA (guanine37-N1)-methyltransferase
MKIDIVTAFPDMLSGIFQESMMKQAQEKGIAEIRTWDLRRFTEDKHKTVDDYPYGGGAGMIMKPEPLFRAVDTIRDAYPDDSLKIIFLSPQGKPFSQDMARDMAEKADHLVFLCGHYRGVDERVIENLVAEEISIGDYILTCGELPAAVVIDAVVRLLPGVLGDFDSAEGDSFHNGKLDFPHYTRPAVFRGLKVPDVLLSGHHAEIHNWRLQESLKRTRKRRPDLLDSNHGNDHLNYNKE